MSSAGHVIDAMKRQQENRKLQKQHQNNGISNYNSSKSDSDKKVFNADKFKPKPEEEAKINRKKIHNTTRKEYEIAWIKTIIFFTILYLIADYTAAGAHFSEFFNMFTPY